ncbi:serine hydrolase [Pedobacter sp. HMF7647]|uniref:Beta-lactamase n=1 Tax=Hufsiella arboris TaxID=2695275 RepID=A0A7K1YG86_9SPHI|nr:class D beta-lactamase [Hufsiella arboris]MXV53009.1 serine hydrolase [Hufsiella arboris]
MQKKIISFLLTVLPTCAFSQAVNIDHFKALKLQGSTTVYDLKADKWHYTDKRDAARKTLPASTFKIANSLIALDTKAIADTDVIIQYDGQPKTFKGTIVPEWNVSTDMKNAFKNSTIWFYVKMAEKIGITTYQHYLRKIHYGNLKIKHGKNGDFWNYGCFGISPINQINFLKALYLNQLPFTKTTIDKVKDMMLIKQTSKYSLYAKTGWSYDGFDNGWWVGYVETGNNIYFFATRVTKSLNEKNDQFSQSRMSITRQVFKELNLISLD